MSDPNIVELPYPLSAIGDLLITDLTEAQLKKAWEQAEKLEPPPSWADGTAEERMAVPLLTACLAQIRMMHNAWLDDQGIWYEHKLHCDMHPIEDRVVAFRMVYRFTDPKDAARFAMKWG